MANKTATVLARVNPELKQEAESIMEEIGVPVSVVINCLYKQIVMTRSIPFALKLPDKPMIRDEMSEQDFNAMLEKGYQEAQDGKGLTVNEAFAKIRQEL